MSGPSRLPLGALRHASRAIGSVAAAAAGPSSSSSAAPSLASSPSAPPPAPAAPQHTTPARGPPVVSPLSLRSAAPLRHVTDAAGDAAAPSSSSSPHAHTDEAVSGSSKRRAAADEQQPKDTVKDADKGTKKEKEKKKKQPKWRGTGQIGEIMHLPALLSPVRVPRNPIVLCHGLYGFDVRGPFLGLEIHYWAAVMDILQKRLGAKVIIRGVPGTGSIQARAEALHAFLCSPEAGVQGKDLNLVGHSMGGLDARHLISNIRPRPEEYRPVSLTTICTPHHGSPFMDWCNANIGIGNDAIEEALREVKAERRMGMAAGSGAARSPAETEYRPPPYSLKSPLFVRQKKTANGEADASAISEDGKSVASSAEERAEVSEKVVRRAKGASANADDEAAAAGERVRRFGSAKDEVASIGGEARAPPKESESKASAIFDSISSAFSTLTGQFSDYMLSVLDTPAYAMLSTKYMNQVFNPTTPDDPNVQYYSVAARTRSIPIWHPLWLPKLILDAAAESRTSGGEADGSGDALGSKMQGNDGLVSVQSAQWGEFLGIVDGCDHWDLRGGGGPRLAGGKAGSGDLAEKDKEASAQAASSAGDAKEAATTSDKSWIDVNQLLGLWRVVRPSQKRDGSEASAGGASRSATDGISTAYGMSTLSASQQRHQQNSQQATDAAADSAPGSESSSSSTSLSEPQSPSTNQQRSRPSILLESLQPASNTQKGSGSVDIGHEPSTAQASDGHGGDNVSEIVQTFMHAYSHLADPKHEESGYDWSAAPSFTPTSDQESIITEIAHWISERLPQRDEGRRAEAEKEAAAHDQELAASAGEHEKALSALEASRQVGASLAALGSSVADQAGEAAARVSAAVFSGADEVASAVREYKAVQPRYRIRSSDEEEDADEEEDREHRPDRAFALVGPAGAAGTAGKESAITRDVEELELFWLAICHHLYARGF